jgi:8-oxo-dGTP pyrophosphatase MutT (NUDIX family)
VQAPLAPRRLGYRVAYRLLHIYWSVVRPHSRGVKCVLTSRGRVLLVRHTYGYPAWELPGGSLRRHELPALAARRETQEELGLAIDHWRPLGDLQVTIDHRPVTLHCFQAELERPAVDLDRGELAIAGWFQRGQLPADLGRYVRLILALLEPA